MKTCPRCGTENADTATACQKCAALLQQSAGKTCPSGRHIMDPAWTECVYCRQENVAPAVPAAPAYKPTLSEAQRPRPVVRTGTRVETMVDDLTVRTPLRPRAVNAPAGVANPPRENTVYQPTPGPGSDPGQASPSVAKDRKIVGVLITYSWKLEGQVFPIREGRNFIGRDKECEVCIAEDQTLSGRNSHITYRQNFVVGDMVSMTGTDVDGVPIEEQFHSLPNYATIRAGSTYFTFIAVKPPVQSGELEGV